MKGSGSELFTPFSVLFGEVGSCFIEAFDTAGRDIAAVDWNPGTASGRGRRSELEPEQGTGLSNGEKGMWKLRSHAPLCRLLISVAGLCIDRSPEGSLDSGEDQVDTVNGIQKIQLPAFFTYSTSKRQ